MADINAILQAIEMMNNEVNLAAECGCKTNNLHPLGNKCKHCCFYANKNVRELTVEEYIKMNMDRVYADVPNE